MQIHEQVLTGTSWKLWDSALKRRSPRTARIYLRHFTNFMKAIKMNSEQYYDAYTKASGREKIALQSMVLDRVQALEDEGYSTSASHQTIKAVSSFLRSNGEAFTTVEKHKRYSQGSRIIEKSEIQLLLEKTTHWRNKAMIMALRDSGLRVSDLAQFTYGHLSECLRKGVDFCIFTLVQEKTNQQAKVCLGFESLEYIGKWIDERQNSGEDLKSDSPLWVTVNSRPDIGVAIGEKLSKYSISSRIRAIITNAGITGVSAHSLRKYFITRMMLSGFHESLIKILIGKANGESKSPYINYSDKQLLEEYKKHYRAIGFESTQGDIDELQNQINEQQKELDRLKHLESTVTNFLQREKESTERANTFAMQKIRELEEKGYKSFVPEGFVEYKPGYWVPPDYNPDDEPPTLEQLLEHPTPQTENTNGSHTVVDNEQTMLKLLDQGYELIKELSNDRYLLKQP